MKQVTVEMWNRQMAHALRLTRRAYRAVNILAGAAEANSRLFAAVKALEVHEKPKRRFPRLRFKVWIEKP